MNEFIDVEINDVEIEKQSAIPYIEGSIKTSPKGKKSFVDGMFAKAYQIMNDVIFSNGAFYSPDGMLSTGTILRDINESLFDIFPSNLSQNTNKALKALKEMAYVENFDFADKNIIPLHNGDLYVNKHKNWVFKLDEKTQVPYRLPVSYTPLHIRKETPYFDKWLDDLFVDEDKDILQEYLGYCLIPTTKAQKSLILIGKGGEGKSILGQIIFSIFGQAMTAPHDVDAFFNDKFKIPELENQLIVFDDDLKNQALSNSGIYKKMITNVLYITADRKGEQPFKFKPFARYIMLSNEMLKSDDDTDGFYRRIIPIHVKAQNPDRKNIYNLGELITNESEGILQWALLGLKRLIDNDYQFSNSDRSNKYLDNYKNLTHNIPTFIEENLQDGGEFTVQDFTDAYQNWCILNNFIYKNKREVQQYLANNYESIGIEQTRITLDKGNRVRGYKGKSLINYSNKSKNIQLS